MKELVEHIRAIHFALAIASVVLLGASLTNPSRTVEQALTDAKLLKELAGSQAALVDAINKTAEKEMGHGDVLEFDGPSVAPGRVVSRPRPSGETHAAARGETLPVVPADLSEYPAHALFKQYGPWIEVKPGATVCFVKQ